MHCACRGTRTKCAHRAAAMAAVWGTKGWGWGDSRTLTFSAPGVQVPAVAAAACTAAVHHVIMHLMPSGLEAGQADGAVGGHLAGVASKGQTACRPHRCTSGGALCGLQPLQQLFKGVCAARSSQPAAPHLRGRQAGGGAHGCVCMQCDA